MSTAFSALMARLETGYTALIQRDFACGRVVELRNEATTVGTEVAVACNLNTGRLVAISPISNVFCISHCQVHNL